MENGKSKAELVVGIQDEVSPIKMTIWQKCFIAGCGAFAPLIINLYNVDIVVLKQYFSIEILLGLLLKVFVLLIIGGIVGFLYREEESGIKLFQLGVAAPSILLGIMNTAIADTPFRHSDQEIARGYIGLSIIELAEDKEGLQDFETVKEFSLPFEKPREKFKRGFTGQKIENNYFLIFRVCDNLEKARAIQIELLKDENFEEVYVYRGPKRGEYSIVIDEFITYDQGLELMEYHNLRWGKSFIYEYTP